MHGRKDVGTFAVPDEQQQAGAADHLPSACLALLPALLVAVLEWLQSFAGSCSPFLPASINDCESKPLLKGRSKENGTSAHLKIAHNTS